MVQVAPLRYGTPFKKAFSDPVVFTTFVHDVLGIDLNITHVEQERAFHPPFGRVDIKYDLFAEDTAQRTIIELQHIRESDSFDRFLYYHLIAQAEQIQSADDYHFRRTVYTVVLLTRLPLDSAVRFDIATHDSDLRTRQGQAMGIYRHRLVFLNVRAIQDDTPPNVKKWLALIEDSLDGVVEESQYEDSVVKRVIEAIRQDRLTPTEAFDLKEEAGWEAAKRELENKGRDEGKIEGKIEGKHEGRLEPLERQFSRRLGRPLTEHERGLLAARVQSEGPEPASDAVLDLSPTELTAWLVQGPASQ